MAQQHGFDITFASPEGGHAPMDPESEEQFKSDPVCQQLLSNSAAMTAIKETRSLRTLNVRDYDGIFVVGGHGTSRPTAFFSIFLPRGACQLVC